MEANENLACHNRCCFLSGEPICNNIFFGKDRVLDSHGDSEVTLYGVPLTEYNKKNNIAFFVFEGANFRSP